MHITRDNNRKIILRLLSRVMCTMILLFIDVEEMWCRWTIIYCEIVVLCIVVVVN